MIILNKYLIIKFLPTLGEYQTRNKYIPFNFFNVLLNFDLKRYEEVFEKILEYSDMLKYIIDEREEYNKFYKFYIRVLNEVGYNEYTEYDIEAITKGQVGNVHKVIFKKDVKDYLFNLSLKYKLVLLVDDFPSIMGSLKYNGVDKYFDNIYITSCYGVKDYLELFELVKEKYNDYVYIDDYNELLKVI